MKNRADHSAFFMPYLADLLPFMVIFEWMLWRQSGPLAYQYQPLTCQSKRNPIWTHLIKLNQTEFDLCQFDTCHFTNQVRHSLQQYHSFFISQFTLSFKFLKTNIACCINVKCRFSYQGTNNNQICQIGLIVLQYLGSSGTTKDSVLFANTFSMNSLDLHCFFRVSSAILILLQEEMIIMINFNVNL